MTNSKLVRGVGVNDKSCPSCIGNGKFTKEYALWKDMLKRCYDPKSHVRRPTYIGCFVSENFKNYSFFYEWVNQQIGFGADSFHLDKDILIPDNNIYSEDACVFVPHEVNMFFVDCGAARGDFPIGVCFHKAVGRFGSKCRVNGNLQHLGLFNTPEEAHATYKQFKENLCKELAKKWRGQIDERVYDAMMRWSV